MSDKIITDLRTLNSIARRFGLKVDREFKYITEDHSVTSFKHNGKFYALRYMSGCFFPYLVQTEKREI